MADEPDAPPSPVSTHPAPGPKPPGDVPMSWWMTPRTWRIAARVTAVLVGLVVFAMVAVTVTTIVLVRRPFPQTTGTITLRGLTSDVTVIRDANGIPNIYADNAQDLFYAQGYVQAQDRFFEMDVRRHTTAGRLSEMFGKKTIDTDMYIRTLGWRRVAEKELKLLNADTLRYLQAFSAGVNAYISTHSLSQMSVEYSLLGLNGLDYKVEAWTPLDSISWLKAMAWDLRGNMTEEIDRATAAGSLSQKQIHELYPPYPYDRHRPILQSGNVVHGVFDPKAATEPALESPSAQRVLVQLGKASAALPMMVGSGDGIGSNSWVVDGKHSQTGMPLLANDPHLGISVPGIWYQMGLHCTTISADCPFDVTGFTFAGLPGVIIGHNANIAWGFTNLGPDVVDLFLEKIKDQKYKYGKRWLPLKERDETIKVAGGQNVTFTVRSTGHGPLLSDVSSEISTAGANAHVSAGAPDRGNGYGVAIEWTALIPSNTADAIFEIDKARDWNSFRAAAADFAVPSQNMVYADTQGNIGYQAPGMIPIRKPANNGWEPAEGWNPKNDWTGRFVPFDQLPYEFNPPSGIIATANQAVIGPGYKHFLTSDWDYGYRSQRIFDLLSQKPTFSVADFTKMQLDDLNNFAATLVPYLLRVNLDAGPYYSAGQQLLRTWDYHQSADSAAAAYFNAVWSNLLALTFDDQLPQSLWPDGSSRWYEVVRRLLVHPNDPWWDNVTTDGVVETRDDILRLAMMDARDDLTRLESENPAAWNWGQLHVLNLQNQTLGQSGIGPVEWLLNRNGYRVGGGEAAIDATGWTASDGYQVDWAPSMRMVVSLADLDASRWINLTGVSGHAFDPHYVDQTALYVDGKTLPWAFSPQAVKAAGQDVLTLQPAD